MKLLISHISRLFVQSIQDSHEYERPITGEEIRDFVDQLTGRHCKRLAEVLRPEIATKDKFTIDELIHENRTKYVNTEQMLIDWLQEQDYCHGEKRRLFHDVVRGLGRGKVEGRIVMYIVNIHIL